MKIDYSFNINSKNDKIGFTAGAFDLLHAGHVHFLSLCAKECNKLIVGLHTDPSIDRPEKNKPLQSTYERFVQLSGSAYVDRVIPYDTEHDLINIIACENIDVRFLGSDYINSNFTGDKICQQKNIDVVFIPRLHDFSSSELRKRIDNAKGYLVG
jgi:glycerol-3-phosphate cytidylyltransferase